MEELIGETLRPAGQLRAELRAHGETIRAAAATNEFLDVSLAVRLTEACEALLDEAERADSEPTRHLVQAAVRYFILDEDGEHDLESVCGLDDDAEVCNAVARHLGREDLTIEV